jgi:hypothetical protein
MQRTLCPVRISKGGTRRGTRGASLGRESAGTRAIVLRHMLLLQKEAIVKIRIQTNAKLELRTQADLFTFFYIFNLNIFNIFFFNFI